MYIIIAGCHKVGASLALTLAGENHDVVVIDSDPERLNALGSGFNGVTLVGMPIDEDVLRSAGIEQADALAAVTDDDNMNIMIAQVAREIFHVPSVITRVYDPRRETIMGGMGLETVCPTTLAVRQIKLRLLNAELLGMLQLGGREVSFRLAKPARKLVGQPLCEARDEPVIGLMRNQTFLPMEPREMIRPEDQLVIAVYGPKEA